jgi:predicted murein hydrolase (TIGR00659 family)
MNEFFAQNVFFGMALTMIAYVAAYKLKQKVDFVLFNPLLVASAAIIAILLIFHIDYTSYHNGAQYLAYFMTPATVCLAVPLYKQFETLKQNLAAVLSGVLCGCIAHAVTIVGLVFVFHMEDSVTLSLLAKSVTTPIALGVCSELGGVEGITLMGLMLAGIMGAVVGPSLLKLFRIKEPVAQGLAIGSASHAVGTSKMLEIGEVQAAMSSLSIAVTGLMTVVVAPIVAQLL